MHPVIPHYMAVHLDLLYLLYNCCYSCIILYTDQRELLSLLDWWPPYYLSELACPLPAVYLQVCYHETLGVYPPSRITNRDWHQYLLTAHRYYLCKYSCENRLGNSQLHRDCPPLNTTRETLSIFPIHVEPFYDCDLTYELLRARSLILKLWSVKRSSIKERDYWNRLH